MSKKHLFARGFLQWGAKSFQKLRESETGNSLGEGHEFSLAVQKNKNPRELWKQTGPRGRRYHVAKSRKSKGEVERA